MITIPCTSCRQMNEPEISTADNQVYCSECGEIYKDASHFLKIQLKSVNQTRKASKSSFNLKCETCKMNTSPKMNKDKVVCGQCNNEYTNVSAPFKIIVKEHLKNSKKDI